jgi:nucleoid-associated protein YgaU
LREWRIKMNLNSFPSTPAPRASDKNCQSRSAGEARAKAWNASSTHSQRVARSRNVQRGWKPKEIAVNKYIVIALWLAVVAVAGTGCASQKKNTTTAKGAPGFSPAVTELGPSPAPVAAAPVFEPAQPIATATPAPVQVASAAGATYQVKRGDTLFAIAKNRYGDGKQWTRIASANPGLSPQNLKAGQKIVIP